MPRTSHFSDIQRRAVCRLVFLFLCALPTTLAIYTIVHKRSPEDWERLIQAQLGIKIQIESVETPRPWHAVLRGVRVPECVLGLPAESNDLVIEEIAIVKSGRKGQISIVHPVNIPTDALTNVVDRCSDHLEQMNLADCPWQVDFSKISLSDHDANVADLVMQPVGLMIERIDATSEQPESYVQVQLLTHLPSENPDSLLKLLFQRMGDNQYVRIETTGFVPCGLFQHWQRDLRWLGQSTFRGNMELRIDRETGIRGDITGDLNAVALDQLAAAYGLPLRGECSLSAIDCRLADSRIESIGFHVSSNRSGTIGKSLLVSAESLEIRSNIDPGATALTFQTLDFDATIADGFLTLSGTNSIMAGDQSGEAVLTCRSDTRIPVYFLAVLLTGEETIGSESIAFLDRFKIPAPRTAVNEVDSTQRF